MSFLADEVKRWMRMDENHEDDEMQDEENLEEARNLEKSK